MVSEGKSVAVALEEAWTDASLKERFFTAPFALGASSGSQSQPSGDQPKSRGSARARLAPYAARKPPPRAKGGKGRGGKKGAGKGKGRKTHTADGREIFVFGGSSRDSEPSLLKLVQRRPRLVRVRGLAWPPAILRDESRSLAEAREPLTATEGRLTSMPPQRLSEDERKRGEDEVQKLTDKYVADCDTAAAQKEKEILTQ